MNQTQDLYAVLGVPPNAFEDDIRRAYRNAARRLHPDVNKHPGAANQFRDITAAHELLIDSVARQKYDDKRKDFKDKEYFTLRITPSKRVLPALSEMQVMYLLLELVPDRTLERKKTTAPMNLTLVVDHSVSMSGIRLERTKIAAHQIIDQLSSEDILSIIAFSDRAEVLVKATPLTDKTKARAMVTTMTPFGGTEILQGLTAGYEENQRHAGPNFVNHIILITDGRTYGDEQGCLELAERAAKAGIGISAMGIGEEWNDVFLDQLVGITGGSSEYINSPNQVVRFLNERVRSLGQSFAERVTVSLAPDPDLKIESAFRLTPNPQPISVDSDPIQVGQLPPNLNTTLLLQIQMPPLPYPGFRSLLRIEAMGDIVWDRRNQYRVIADTSIEVSTTPPAEEPPLAILDALGKLTLYRMQQKAEEALQKGNVRDATRRLENLATRLLAAGEEDLANAAMTEARRVASTNMLSEEGHKRLKYGTRMLLDAPKEQQEAES